MILDIFAGLFGLVVGILFIIYLYFNITKNTRPVKGKCISIKSKSILFLKYYIPLIEYKIDNKIYTTEYAFNPSLIYNRFKVNKLYNFRYKIKIPEEAYHYNILAFILVIIMCAIHTIFAYMLYIK